MQTLAPTVPNDLRALLRELELQPLSSLSSPPRTPDALLDAALSLGETVRLGAELDDRARTDGEIPARSELRRHSSNAAAARLEALRARIHRTYRQASGTKSSIPTPAHMLSMLRDARTLTDCPETRTQLTRKWAASYAQLFLGLVTAMRRDLELFRLELTPQLRGSSDATERLLRLDTTLDPVLARMTIVAHGHLASALETRCAARFERAVSALTPDCDEAKLTAWVAPSGVAGRCLAQCRKLTHALLDLEWAPIQALIDSVCGREVTKGAT